MSAPLQQHIIVDGRGGSRGKSDPQVQRFAASLGASLDEGLSLAPGASLRVHLITNDGVYHNCAGNRIPLLVHRQGAGHHDDVSAQAALDTLCLPRR